MSKIKFNYEVFRRLYHHHIEGGISDWEQVGKTTTKKGADEICFHRSKIDNFLLDLKRNVFIYKIINKNLTNKED